jgi:hypothetical protein
MQISILGIDIGKNSCSVVGVDDRGAVVVRRAMRRHTLIEFVEKLPTWLSRWRPAVVLTIFAGSLPREAMRLG